MLWEEVDRPLGAGEGLRIVCCESFPTTEDLSAESDACLSGVDCERVDPVPTSAGRPRSVVSSSGSSGTGSLVIRVGRGSDGARAPANQVFRRSAFASCTVADGRKGSALGGEADVPVSDVVVIASVLKVCCIGGADAGGAETCGRRSSEVSMVGDSSFGGAVEGSEGAGCLLSVRTASSQIPPRWKKGRLSK